MGNALKNSNTPGRLPSESYLQRTAWRGSGIRDEQSSTKEQSNRFIW